MQAKISDKNKIIVGNLLVKLFYEKGLEVSKKFMRFGDKQ
jgi:hypothetical protein